MPKTVILEDIQGAHWEKQLKRRGVTIKFNNKNNPQKDGSLRIGLKVRWRPAGNVIWKTKDWEQLIDFFMKDD